MKRRLCTILAAFSLLLAAVIAAAWVRSYFVTDGWSWSDGVRVPTAGYMVSWRKAVISERGRLFVIHDRSMGGGAYSKRLPPEHARFLPRLDPAHDYLGFGHQGRLGYPGIANVEIGPPVEITIVHAVPYWPFFLAAAAPPGWWMAWRRRQNRLSQANRCAACGYDLRASRDKCPECGAAVESKEDATQRVAG